MVSAIGNLNILEKMSTFEAANTSNPMFKVMLHYMHMVMEILAYFFFAHDKINYTCMILVFLAKMSSSKASDPEIHDEFTQENWVLTIETSQILL